MKRKTPRKPPKGSVAQRGTALVVGLLTVTVLSIVGVNASSSSVTQYRMANNYRWSIEAMNNAEVGFLTAFATMNDQELALDGFDDQLDLNADGILNDRFSLALADQAKNVFYSVVVVDDDDGDGDLSADANGIIRLLSQGTSDMGSTRTVEVRVQVDTSGRVLEKAILADESITFSGNSEYYGSNQDIHSNENLYQTDHPTTSGTMSASGTAYGGDPEGGGQAVSNADEVWIPDIVPSEFEDYVDFVFHSNGRIYNSAGTQVANANGSTWNGWKFDGAKWTTQGDTGVLGGDLYFKGQYGNVVVGSNPGTVSNPWEVTIFADGYIELSGNPIIANYVDPDDPLPVQQILFMAGTDIKINGNASQTFTGVIAAAEQFMISGNPNVEASILSGGQDNSDTNDSDLVTQNSISGDMSLTYDGTLRFPGNSGQALVLSWQEREIARNTGVFASQT